MWTISCIFIGCALGYLLRSSQHVKRWIDPVMQVLLCILITLQGVSAGTLSLDTRGASLMLFQAVVLCIVGMSGSILVVVLLHHCFFRHET